MRRDLAAREQRQRLRARPFYFNYVDVNPKNRDEVWVNALGLAQVDRRRQDLSRSSDAARRQPRHLVQPRQPETAIQCNDGGANVTRDGGRSWSSILNQPTAEFYMVAWTSSIRICSTVRSRTTRRSSSRASRRSRGGSIIPAQAWTQASGCETGGIVPTPDGKVIWGACKGEVERFSVETGQ